MNFLKNKESQTYHSSCKWPSTVMYNVCRQPRRSKSNNNGGRHGSLRPESQPAPHWASVGMVEQKWTSLNSVQHKMNSIPASRGIPYRRTKAQQSNVGLQRNKWTFQSPNNKLITSTCIENSQVSSTNRICRYQKMSNASREQNGERGI
jgi:hypothetical protein